jgi:hypothetical protein
MKTKNVREGGRYWANVSGQRVEVEVVRADRDVSFGGRRRTTKFLVRRVDNGQLLPKRRTAAALHPSGETRWPGMTERQEDLGALDVTYYVYGLAAGHTPITFDTADEFIEAMEDRGFEHMGYSRTGGRLRPELQGQPKFRELAGPMYDGGRVRYETWALNERLNN